MKIARPLAATAALVACSIATLALRAEEWPHWRGPNRDDTTDASSGYDGESWPLREAWTAEVGEGSSSPVVADGRLYVMGWSDGAERALCLDAASGKTVWARSYASPRYGREATGDQGLYSGPSSTPEYDRETKRLYTLGADGELRCWTAAEGELVWRLNLYEAYDVPRRPQVERSGRRDYGYTSSPLVMGDLLIVEVGAQEGTIVAFDKATGREVWRSKANSPAGHNGGPVPIEVEGVPCVAAFTFDGLLVVRTDPRHEGETVATVPWVTSFANNVASPTVHGDSVLITSSYNRHEIARVRVTLDGPEIVWRTAEASKVCSPVVTDGYVYWAWQRMTCLDFETGEVVWQGGRFGDPGSLIATSDDRLIAWSGRGDLTLVDSAVRSPESYREIASHTRIARDDAWPHLALADRRLYLKDRTGRIVCLTIE